MVFSLANVARTSIPYTWYKCSFKKLAFDWSVLINAILHLFINASFCLYFPIFILSISFNGAVWIHWGRMEEIMVGWDILITKMKVYLKWITFNGSLYTSKRFHKVHHKVGWDNISLLTSLISTHTSNGMDVKAIYVLDVSS